MKREVILLLSVMLSMLTAFAQGEVGGMVSGQVKSISGEELINAIITFKNLQDSTKIYPTICDVQGRYHQELPYGEYSYVISYIGENYTPEKNRVLVNKSNTEIPEINIKLKEKELSEVVVTAKRPFVSYNGSVARYNLSANPASIGGNILDGVKLIPGVQIQESGGLSIFGFYNLTVAVNRQVLRLSNEEIQAYLASLSVTDVEAVEIIRHPGPEYGMRGDAILNIITKKKPNEGISAFISMDAIYRKLLSENARIRINYNKKNWRNYVSYQFFDTRHQETLTTSIGADTTTTKPYRGHSLQTGFEWQVSPKQLIEARGHLSLSKESIDYNHTNRIDMNRNVATLNLYHTLSEKNWDWKNYADYTFSSNGRNYFYGNTNNNSLQDRFHYLRIASDFIYWPTPTLGVLIGGSQNNMWFVTKSPMETDLLNNAYDESNTSAYLTIRYRNGSIDTYGGVQFNYDQRKGIAQERISHFDNTHHWQPYFSFAYDISRNHRISTSLQTYYQRPSFRDLMPYASYSGFLHRLGNPKLKNSTRYNLSLNYAYMRAATLEINLSNERCPIIEYLTPYNGGYALTKTNLDYSRYLRIVAGAPIPIIYKEDGLQWIASTYLAYHVQQDKGDINALDYNRTFTAYYAQHKQSLNLPSQWYFDAQITYYSPLFLGVYKTEKQWWINFSISKRIQNWKFSLNGYDILNTNLAKGEIVGMENPISFVQNWHSPKITFSISCTLGNKSLKTSDRKNINSESRLSQSANEGINLQQ